MFGDGGLTLREFVMREPVPLATIHAAILELLRNRQDAALFGAQAVNAYVDEPRMTQDVDILCTNAAAFAEELRQSLADRFHIAVRSRMASDGKSIRIFQLRQPKNRHLADVRQVDQLPPHQLVMDIRVLAPEELIAQKIISSTSRGAAPKGDTDRRDLKILLLRHPHLKSDGGAVMERLKANSASAAAIEQWHRLVASDIRSDESDDDD
jgi:hypothetical protein